MQQLSSSWTLPLKIFFPVFLLGFFGSFALTVLFSDVRVLGGVSLLHTRIILVGIVAVLVWTYWRWILPLKRVDADGEYFYVSDYFKTVRFTRDSVKSLTVRKNWVNSVARIELHQKGTFGRIITFLPSKPRLQAFLDA